MTLRNVTRLRMVHGSLSEILTDRKLASLGDALVNFAYSVALSNRTGEPSGEKMKGRVLAAALKRSGLRENMPARTTRHQMADAAEALIVHAWIEGLVGFEEIVGALERREDPVDGVSLLLATIKERSGLE